MSRYLTTGGRWVSTENETPGVPGAETLVESGMLHSSHLELDTVTKAQFDLLTQGIIPSGMVRLTDGPSGIARYASYYDVLMSNPWGYGTIHTIARGLARLPLKLYETDLDKETEPGTVQRIIQPNRARGTGGKIAWALRYPNAGGQIKDAAPSRRALWYGTVVNKLVHGNALWEIIRDDFGAILGFQLHPMEQVMVDEDNLIYEVQPLQYSLRSLGIRQDNVEDKKPKVLTADKVCHFGLWESGRRPLNPSPVRSLHHTVALYDAISRYMVGFFNNGARVSGMLQVQPGMDPKAKEDVRQEVLKLYTGPQNAGRILITSGQWQAFHREPQFDGIVSLIKFSRDEIFVTYGVPPPVMGVIERAIMANAREMRDQYVRDLIGPHAEFLSGDFEAQIIDREATLRGKNVFAYFDVDEQLRPDLWKRAASFRNILLAYTPNELRRIEHNQQLDDKQDPNGYANTIQRPLNESAINNVPNYGFRESLQERQVEIQEKQAEQQQPAPESEEEGNDGNQEDQE